MYKAPIELESVVRDVSQKIADQTDAVIYEAVLETGVKVNRFELIKALTYDRRQYERGYKDGMADAIRTGRWIIVRSENNPRARRLCSECRTVYHQRASKYCPNCGALMVARKEVEL